MLRRLTASLDRALPRWRKLPPTTFDEVAECVATLRSVDADLVPSSSLPVNHLSSRSTELADAAVGLDRLESLVAALHRDLGLVVPDAPGVHDVDRVLRIASLLSRRRTIDRAWFEPGGLDRARGALATLTPLLEDEARFAAVLQPYFDEIALTMPMLATDIDTLRSGAVAGLSPDGFRRLRACARSGDLGPAELARMPTLVRARDSRAALITWTRSHAADLGTSFEGPDTSLTDIEASIASVDELLAIAPDSGPALAGRFACGHGPPQALLAIATEAARLLLRWRRDAAVLSADPSRLLEVPLSDAALRCHAAAEGIERLAQALWPVQVLTGDPLLLGGAADLAADVADLTDAARRLGLPDPGREDLIIDLRA